jgi:hypothetical protein
MKIITTKNLSKNQKIQIMNLWNNEYPSKLYYKNYEQFENYLNKLNEKNHTILIDEKETIIGWYVDFIREYKKWFAMNLDSKFQGIGFGTELLNQAKLTNKNLTGW